MTLSGNQECWQKKITGFLRNVLKPAIPPPLKILHCGEVVKCCSWNERQNNSESESGHIWDFSDSKHKSTNNTFLNTTSSKVHNIERNILYFLQKRQKTTATQVLRPCAQLAVERQERRMNFSYEFEGQPADFQADSFCDDTAGGWEGFDYGEER